MRRLNPFQRRDTLSDALAASLDALASGASVDECLRRFPTHAEALRPLLEAARQLHAYGERAVPSPAARARARSELLARAAARQPAPIVPHPAVHRRGWLALAPAAMAAVVFAAVAVPLLGALDSGAIPGDWNYGLKRAGERVQLALTTDPADRRLLRLEFARRRLTEIEQLAQHGRVDTRANVVTTLVHDYTQDMQQVQRQVAAAPIVDSSTKQALDKTTQQAQEVLPQIAQSAPPPVVAAAQTAQSVTVEVKQTADTLATADKRGGARPQAAQTQQAQPPAADQSAVQLTPQPTPSPTLATPSPTASAPPTATPTPAPATPPPPQRTQPAGEATPELRPDQRLPAVLTTPAPQIPTNVPTPSTPSPATAPPVVAAAPSSSATPQVASAADATPTGSATTPTPAPTTPPIALHAGDNIVRYTGEPIRLDALLGPILPNVVFVDYADAAGVPHRWYPGTSAPLIGPTNGVMIVRVRADTTLTLP